MDLRSLSAWLAGASGSQGLQRLLWLSDVAGAARLLRWWGKVGMSSGSQAAGRGPSALGGGLSQAPGATPHLPPLPCYDLQTVCVARVSSCCLHRANTPPG